MAFIAQRARLRARHRSAHAALSAHSEISPAPAVPLFPALPGFNRSLRRRLRSRKAWIAGSVLPIAVLAALALHAAQPSHPLRSVVSSSTIDATLPVPNLAGVTGGLGGMVAPGFPAGIARASADQPLARDTAVAAADLWQITNAVYMAQQAAAIDSLAPANPASPTSAAAPKGPTIDELLSAQARLASAQLVLMALQQQQSEATIAAAQQAVSQAQQALDAATAQQASVDQMLEANATRLAAATAAAANPPAATATPAAVAATPAAPVATAEQVAAAQQAVTDAQNALNSVLHPYSDAQIAAARAELAAAQSALADAQAAASSASAQPAAVGLPVPDGANQVAGLPAQGGAQPTLGQPVVKAQPAAAPAQPAERVAGSGSGAARSTPAAASAASAQPAAVGLPVPDGANQVAGLPAQGGAQPTLGQPVVKAQPAAPVAAAPAPTAAAAAVVIAPLQARLTAAQQKLALMTAPPDPVKLQQAQDALATAQQQLAALQAPPDAQAASANATPAPTTDQGSSAAAQSSSTAAQSGDSQSAAHDANASPGSKDTSATPKLTVAQAQQQYDSAVASLKLVSAGPDPSIVAAAGKAYDDAQSTLSQLLAQADPEIKAQIPDDPSKALAQYEGMPLPGVATDPNLLLRMTGTTPGMLGPLDIARLLVAAGAKDPNEITTLTAIALAESGGNPAVPNAQGSGALGLFQFTPSTAAIVGLADPTNAAASAAAAVKLVSLQGYGSWEAFTKGTYLRYMSLAGAGFIMPAQGPVTSFFGPSHPLGIDIGQAMGLPVRAAATGVVSFSGGDPCCSYGYYVDIVHPGGYMTRYGHLMVPSFLKPGDPVLQGQIIGVSGTTGFSTGPHVHFEIRLNGVPLDPLKVLIGALPINPLQN